MKAKKKKKCGPNFEKEAVKALRDSGANLSMTGALLAVEAVTEALRRRHNATLRLAEKAVYKASDCGFLFSEEIRKLKVKS